MPVITVGGRALNYVDVGAGEPVLLFHGFPFASDSYWPQIERPPEGCRLLIPELRGFGKSELGTGEITLDSYAEDGLALMDALKLPSAFVGGVSMGGYVSIALTRLDPGRVRGLVLIDTQSSADDDAGKARREAVAVEVAQKGTAGLIEGMLPRLMKDTAAAEVKARVRKVMEAQSPEAVAAASRAMASRKDGRDILTRFAGPVQVIVGRDDVITPVAKAQEMAALVRGAQLEIVEHAGHLVNLEQPEVFAQVLTRFVTQNRG